MSKETDWTPGRIRQAIKEKGISQAALARQAGLSEGAVRTATYTAGPAAERAISEFLGVPLHEIWPSRYYPDGRSKTVRRLPRHPSANAYPPHRQIGGAA